MLGFVSLANLGVPDYFSDFVEMLDILTQTVYESLGLHLKFVDMIEEIASLI